VSQDNTGTLYIVATPIGNLGDITERAVRVLGEVAIIAAEDTRRARALLSHFGIDTPLTSFHEHNEKQMVPRLLQRLKGGEDIAVVSDAGTPLISDPGFSLVRESRAAGVRVLAVPGCCAITAALSIAGLPTDRFVFEGFLPSKGGERRRKLEMLREEPRTLVFYESPHRILDSVQDIIDVLGEKRSVTLARELTKVHETVLSGSAAEIAARMRDDPNQQRGEFVMMIEGAPARPASHQVTVAVEHVLAVLVEQLPVKQAAELAAAITGEKKNRLYRRALAMKEAR
jgi:16S rRNA (cytidine1402-2'-O)-methyltransferase